MKHKANGTLALIYKVFECKDADHDIMLNLHKFLVRPQLEYNNVIWGLHYITDKRKVEAIQRLATWMISAFSELSYTDHLQYLNLPPLQHRRRRGDLLLLYQMIHNHYDLNCTSFFSHSTISDKRSQYKVTKATHQLSSKVILFFSKSNE